MSYVIILGIFLVAGYALGECNGGCKQPTLLYEDLNCKPIYASQDDCCPSEYDCSHVELRVATSSEVCYFHGKIYQIGERVDDYETSGHCALNCKCIRKRSGKMGFSCAKTDCHENVNPYVKPPCYLKYKLGRCCSIGRACPPFSSMCKVGNRIYHEGQMFFPDNEKCTKCVCENGFKGKLEAPFCQKHTCDVEIQRHLEVYSFCAPSYIKLDDCCPFNWICPENDGIIPNKHARKKLNLKCQFGEMTLNIGDKFERTHGEKGKLTCECRIPPYLTCIQNHFYPAYQAATY